MFDILSQFQNNTHIVMHLLAISHVLFYKVGKCMMPDVLKLVQTLKVVQCIPALTAVTLVRDQQ